MAEDVGLFEVDVLGVVDAVGQRVLGGVPAQVLGLAVVPLAAHLASAQAAQQDAAQRVGTGRALFVLGLAAAPCERHLGAVEVFLADDRRVGLLLGEDPLAFRVPPLLGSVAERDVLDVEQDFVGRGSDVFSLWRRCTATRVIGWEMCNACLRAGHVLGVGERNIEGSKRAQPARRQR